MSFDRPEPHFFTFKDNGERWAVRVDAFTLDAAKAEFEAMSRAEKRARAIGRLEGGERDHSREIGAWILGFFRQDGRAAYR